MKLPPEIQFYKDIRLLVYRPRGLIDETAVNKIITVIEEIEAASREPFNRFTDASEAHEVELNFRYVIEVSLHRRAAHAGRVPVKSAILATDSTIVHYPPVTHPVDRGFFDQSPGIRRPHRSCAMAWRAGRITSFRR